MKKLKKYYVGSESIGQHFASGVNDPYTQTYEEAIKKATEMVQNDDREVAIIVKIVAVVKKKSQPVVVEVVR
jgi:hypothetical protein